jgi:flagellar biosynthesis GTPase FlhF
MGIRSISRGAVDGAVKLTRLPVDIGMTLIPGDGGARPAAKITIDRLDAALRDAAGVVLLDSELRDDAKRRRVAADERARALRLRTEAADSSASADERFTVRVDEAEQRRSATERHAERQRSDAEQRRQQRVRAAAEAERQRVSASERKRAQVGDALDEAADEARLEQLRVKASALEERERALAAESEAQRLQDEASKKRAARKSR